MYKNISVYFYYYLFTVVDCLLSEWGPWSECDAKCGTGMMSRTRSILRAPENGGNAYLTLKSILKVLFSSSLSSIPGKHCASLTQKRGCQGYKCNSVHEKKYLKGKNMIL